MLRFVTGAAPAGHSPALQSAPPKNALHAQVPGLAAGIGNLYASEILFSARIDPEHPANGLDDKQVSRLVRATRDVLRTAIRYEGSTLSDGTYRNALNQNGWYQNSHCVYDRAGQPCVVCTAPIVRIVQAQRSTFFCPACQDSLRQEAQR